jgi:GDP/UDP-N,N'-diacetylbacillosamine 2-epimerase (hydrolysing)
LRHFSPDWLVVLGDRFEIFAAATAAMLVGTPIAHIHGGERTEGALDERIRHAVTKMSMLHFVSTPEYRKRVIQLGEEPERVLNVGAIGLDRIHEEELLSKGELANLLGLDITRPWCTVTYHSVTTNPDSVEQAASELIAAMVSRQDLLFVITKANADEGGRKINRMLSEYTSRAQNATLLDSLGSRRYLSCVKASALVLGNSSSGLIEAPYLKTPTVNIGIRQRGRARGASVIECSEDQYEIEAAIKAATTLTNDDVFTTSPYYNGGAAESIMRVLKNSTPPRIKSFHDVSFELGIA